MTTEEERQLAIALLKPLVVAVSLGLAMTYACLGTWFAEWLHGGPPKRGRS